MYQTFNAGQPIFHPMYTGNQVYSYMPDIELSNRINLPPKINNGAMDISDMDDFIREQTKQALADRSADPPLFPSDTNLPRVPDADKLNYVYYGRRYTEYPDHPELFLGDMSPNPSYDLDFQELRRRLDNSYENDRIIMDRVQQLTQEVQPWSTEVDSTRYKRETRNRQSMNKIFPRQLPDENFVRPHYDLPGTLLRNDVIAKVNEVDLESNIPKSRRTDFSTKNKSTTTHKNKKTYISEQFRKSGIPIDAVKGTHNKETELGGYYNSDKGYSLEQNVNKKSLSLNGKKIESINDIIMQVSKENINKKINKKVNTKRQEHLAEFFEKSYTKSPNKINIPKERKQNQNITSQEFETQRDSMFIKLGELLNTLKVQDNVKQTTTFGNSHDASNKESTLREITHILERIYQSQSTLFKDEHTGEVKKLGPLNSKRLEVISKLRSTLEAENKNVQNNNNKYLKRVLDITKNLTEFGNSKKSNIKKYPNLRMGNPNTFAMTDGRDIPNSHENIANEFRLSEESLLREANVFEEVDNINGTDNFTKSNYVPQFIKGIDQNEKNYSDFI